MLPLSTNFELMAYTRHASSSDFTLSVRPSFCSYVFVHFVHVCVCKCPSIRYGIYGKLVGKGAAHNMFILIAYSLSERLANIRGGKMSSANNLQASDLLAKIRRSIISFLFSP